MPTRSPVSVTPKRGDLTGARLACLVLRDWRELPEPQYRALMCMALTSLDDPKPDGAPAATYWGGHERIASTFRTWPEDDSPHEPDDRARRRKNILREARRAIEGLQERGAVKVTDPSRVTAPGISQAYTLTLRRERA